MALAAQRRVRQSGMDEQVTALIRRFGRKLRGSVDKLRCFHAHGVQIEGWLKGEILLFLDEQKRAGALADFDREVRRHLGQKRKQIDLRVTLEVGGARQNAWIELKHWLLEQKGTVYRPTFYFGDASSVGARPDVEALSRIKGDTCYLVILMTANPGLADWEAGIVRFNEKFGPLKVVSLTSPREFPNDYHLGLLKVGSRSGR